MLVHVVGLYMGSLYSGGGAYSRRFTVDKKLIKKKLLPFAHVIERCFSC